MQSFRCALGFLLLLWQTTTVAAGDIERGLLWQVTSPQGPVSYLFGTLHSHDERVTAFSPRLLESIRQVDVFMPEAVAPERADMMFMAQGTLRDLLPVDEVEAVLRQADAYVLRESIALRMKPWLLAIALGQPDASGLPTQDVLLMEVANLHRKSIEQLEDATVHFSAMDALKMEDQLALLRASVHQTQEEKAQAFEQLIAVYLGRQAPQIAALDERLSAKGLPEGVWPKMRRLLLDDRNARMAERLLDSMRDRSVFVAVGASHLPGPDGLVSRLRRAGFKVEALE